MSPKRTPKTRKLVLSRETLRNLHDLGTVRFGPQTSETEACCPTVDTRTAPIDTL